MSLLIGTIISGALSLPSVVMARQWSARTQYNYTLTINTSGQGSVSKSSSQASYTSGSIVQLTATPSPGWGFTGWSGDLAGSANPATITMNGNKAVTATFTQSQYTLTPTISPTSDGTVTKSPNQSTYHYGDTVTLTESPSSGYTFSAWSGDGTGTGTTRTVTVTGNMAVTATFTKASSAVYTVLVSGSTYTTKNLSGGIIYSGSSASTAIQSAINNLTPNRTSKEKILLQGDFTLTNTITIANYMILELNGKITLANAVNKYILYGSGKSNFEIRGGEWNGNKAGQTLTSSSVRGIELESCTDFTISGITMHDTVDDGIAAITCLRVTVNFNTIYNTAGALNLAYTSNSQINNNTCHDTTAGIYLYTEDDGIVQHVDNNVVTGNICYNIYHTGISISLRGPEDTGMGNTIADNTVYDCGTDGSHAHMGMGWAPGPVVDARFAANNLFTRNKVYDTGAYVCGPGVSISGVDNEISYNKIHDLTYSALIITGERNTVINNQISITKSLSSFGIEL